MNKKTYVQVLFYKEMHIASSNIIVYENELW